MSAPVGPDLHAFEHHWQDEADAAYLYRLLADAEPDKKKSDLYRRLAAVEDRHVEIWADLLREHGREPGAWSHLPRGAPGWAFPLRADARDELRDLLDEAGPMVALELGPRRERARVGTVDEDRAV